MGRAVNSGDMVAARTMKPQVYVNFPETHLKLIQAVLPSMSLMAGIATSLWAISATDAIAEPILLQVFLFSICKYFYYFYAILLLTFFCINPCALRILLLPPCSFFDYTVFLAFTTLPLSYRVTHDLVTSGVALMFWCHLLILSFDYTCLLFLSQHPVARLYAWYLFFISLIPLGLPTYSSNWPDRHFGNLL